MDTNEIVNKWKREEQQQFLGWDFSYLGARLREGQTPWSYSSRAAELMRNASSVIDLGTGGGEQLLQLYEHWPDNVVATEDYPLYFRLATKRLSPYGARVVDAKLTDYAPMPFTDGEFDLVLNRHSAFNSGEVARILAPGGVFLTQQIHGLWAHDLLAVFGVKPRWPSASFEWYEPKLKEAGLIITHAQEWTGQVAFTDVGAIVYYLKAVPWLVAGFSVDTHLEGLLKLQRMLEGGASLVFSARKYIIEAHKESSS
jgi:SAM-dependent methyltransferase